MKNEDEFKRTEAKLEGTFKNILPIQLPEDLTYFNKNMEKQLQELKTDLSNSKQNKTGHLEWTSKLYCLSRYMYHEINELFNLLQVIFGELVKKNKKLIEVTEDYEYLRENETILRNLI